MNTRKLLWFATNVTCRGARSAVCARPDAGFSLAEVLVALTIFAVGLLGLARAGFATSQALRSGRSLIGQWTVAQSKLDSLASLSWDALDGESGSDATDGYNVSWTASGSNPRKIVLVVERRVLARISTDTFTTYVGKR